MTTLTNLKVLLLKDDLPAYKVAAKLGLHPSILSEYALGKKTIPKRHIRPLCRYFKVTQQELLGTSEFSDATE